MTAAFCAIRRFFSEACKTEQVLELGSHDLFLARIVGVGVKEELMDASGNIDVQKAGLVAYCHGIYHGYTTSRTALAVRCMNISAKSVRWI